MTTGKNANVTAGAALRVLVVIPTYNDVELLESIVDEVSELYANATVLVIDDGSEPPVTSRQIADHCLLVRLPDNFGLGTCMHVAFDCAVSQGFDIVVRVDADGQHPIDRISDLIEPIIDGRADYVVGSRVNRNVGGGPIRSMAALLLREYMAICTRLLTKGRSPPDVTSGFIAAARSAVEVLNRSLLEQYPEPQMCLAVGQAGLRTAAVEVLQSDRIHGRSTISAVAALSLFYRFTIIVLASVLQGKSGK